METTNLADLYELPDLAWADVVEPLDKLTMAPGTGGPDRHSCWLATLDADGAPHVTGIGAQWHRGTFWFETGEHTRKGRNLARDSRCTISVATRTHDVTFEGNAELVEDPALVAELAAVWAEGGWPCEVDQSGLRLTAPFSAPSAGKPPWAVYRMTITSATALSCVEPGGATRFDF
jgi:hypothetical protein